MAFDFLPDNTPPPSKPNTEEGTGGKFNVGSNVFFDDYLHHLDAHKLISTPPKRQEFNLQQNFDQAEWIFSEDIVKNRVNRDWYGINTDYDNLVNGYTKFQDPKLLDQVMNKVNNEIKEDLFSGIEKPKMLINDRFGIFSFDLASMAMTYVYEYYTADNEKVDANQVEKTKNGKFIFTPTNEEVDQRIKRRPDGTPVVVSSVKKSLIDFDKKNKEERSVEILVANSFAASEDPKQVIYNSMAAISVAQNLLKKGFRVKLTSLLAVRNKLDKKNYYHFVPAKRFNQPLDVNAAAYVCGDPRFFRYQGFKMIISGYDRNNAKTPDGIGFVIDSKTQIAQAIEKDYVPNSDLKQADTRLYFGGSRSLEMAKKEVEQALEILTKKYGKN